MSAPPKVGMFKSAHSGQEWDLQTYPMDELLGKAFLFFEFQESGRLRPGHRAPWRGDSYLHDGKKEGLDLVGGWHDAGGALGSFSSL